MKNSRNFDNLVETLFHSFRIIPTISWGVTPEELPCYGTTLHLHEGKYRPLSCHEVAAALSHSRARELAYAEGREWNIFLEDDSELIRSENSEFITSLLKLPSEIPFFVHLFPEQNGILTSSQYPGMNSIRKIPDYANAYAVNAKGLKLFLKNADRSHMYLADWPRFSRRIKKIATSTSIFRHPSQSTDSSLISNERILIQMNSRAFGIKYRLKQAIFRILRIPSAKFGTESIANVNLRSIKWL